MARLRWLRHPLVMAGAGIGVSVWILATLHVSLYRIETGSMEPYLPPGTIVLDVNHGDVRPGQVASFRADGDIVTHGVVGVNADGSLRTRGLANRAEDTWLHPVRSSDVQGRVLLGFRLFAPSFWLRREGLIAGVGLVVAIPAIVGATKPRRGFVGTT